MSTATELRAQAEELMRKADEQEAAERTKLFDGVLEKLTKAGFTVSELMEYTNPKRKKGGIAPNKFRGPGGELWSGFGRHPVWFDAAVKEGHTEDSMRLK